MDPSTRPSTEHRWQATRPGAAGSRRGALPLGMPRITPTRVTLAVAIGGSVLFVLYGIFARDATQIPVLSAGFAVLGLVFSALALAGVMATYRSAQDGEGGRAFGLALLGGLAALVAAGSLATAAVLALVWRA
jgi:hypothetical protein